MPVLRSDDARSRRTAGARWLTCLGSRIRPSAATGVGKSAADSRPAQRSSVSTSGRGSSPLLTPGSRTTASPARRPPGTAMTSPGRSAAQRVRRGVALLGLPLRGAAPSPARRAVRRSAAYSAKSPRWQRIEPAYPARVSVLRSICRASPTTDRSAWNWRERLLEQLAGRRDAEPADQVDGHVVAGPEASCAAGRCGSRPGRRPARGSTPGCQTTTAWPSTSMPRRPARPVSWVYSPGVRSACASPLNLTSRSSTTVRAGMLMPSARVSVAKTASHQPADEQLLDGLLERRQQPRVVRGDPPLERLAPLPVAQHAQVGLGQVTGAALDDPADLVDLVLGGQPQPGTHALGHGGVAAGAAEHEGDRRAAARRGPAGPAR